jgi:hypothetical protein
VIVVAAAAKPGSFGRRSLTRYLSTEFNGGESAAAVRAAQLLAQSVEGLD